MEVLMAVNILILVFRVVTFKYASHYYPEDQHWTKKYLFPALYSSPSEAYFKYEFMNSRINFCKKK
jgi:hypothetical protein